MIPFSPLMYPDDVVHFRSVAATASRRTFPTPGVALKASVRSKRMDRNVRVATVTIHVVRTATGPRADAADKFEWLGRTLTVESPGGIGDVLWITPTKETK